MATSYLLARLFKKKKNSCSVEKGLGKSNSIIWFDFLMSLGFVKTASCSVEECRLMFMKEVG